MSQELESLESIADALSPASNPAEPSKFRMAGLKAAAVIQARAKTSRLRKGAESGIDPRRADANLRRFSWEGGE